MIQKHEVSPQPAIPPGVKDVVVKQEYPSSHPWIFTITSTGDGLDRWAKQRAQWGMSADVIAESKPDAIEYFRDVCEYWIPGCTLQLVEEDGVWYWVIETED